MERKNLYEDLNKMRHQAKKSIYLWERNIPKGIRKQNLSAENYILWQWFSTGGHLSFQVTFGNMWEYFWLSQLQRDALDISWVKAKDVAPHSTMYRTMLTYVQPRIIQFTMPNSAEAVKFWFKPHSFSKFHSVFIGALHLSSPLSYCTIL